MLFTRKQYYESMFTTNKDFTDLLANWQQHTEKYLIFARDKPVYFSREDYLLYKMKEDIFTEKQIKALYAGKELPVREPQTTGFDQFNPAHILIDTGLERRVPFRKNYYLPYWIYYFPNENRSYVATKHRVTLNYNDNYDDYLRIVCMMLHAGVRVIYKQPSSYFRAKNRHDATIT